MDWLAMEAEPLRRMGEWLDAHPLVALAAVIACVLVGGWIA